MQKLNTKRGFTLLELLLVVGIAAVLIVAGITTYSLVTKSNAINETARLVNTLMDQTRRMYAGQSSFGTATLETALYNTGATPAKYRSETPGVITSPFSTTAAAVAIVGATNNFTVSLAIPPSYVPELAGTFDPRTSNEISGLTACGTAIDDNSTPDVGTPAALAATCGASRAAPAAANFIITTR